MRYSAEYVADVLRLIGDHFRARGYSDAWLFSLAEDGVHNWRWELARRAIDLFWSAHRHELLEWEKGAINYIDFLFSLEGIIHRNELWGVETAEVEELPL